METKRPTTETNREIEFCFTKVAVQRIDNFPVSPLQKANKRKNKNATVNLQ